MTAYDVQRSQAPAGPQILDSGAQAAARSWRGHDLAPADWHVPIPRAAADEIGALVERLGVASLATEHLLPEMFSLGECSAFMRRVRAAVDSGIGFAVLDRLPLEEWTLEQTRCVFWLLGSLAGRPVAQSTDGRMIYEVRDTGRLPGGRVRRDSTRVAVPFHTDNNYNTTPPEAFVLLSVRPGVSGGESAVLSFYAVREALKQRDPTALARLCEPYCFDRQQEHGPDEPPYFSAPVFSCRGTLHVRYSDALIPRGYALAGKPIDEAGRRALDALAEVLAEPALAVHFDLAPGQILILNNAFIGHARTAFTDHTDPARRRLMLRLWLRDEGSPYYSG